MSSYSHGHIIPLVGGSAVGTTIALGRDPEWIASWSDTFGLNDSYCLKFFSEIPFFNLDENAYPKKYVDIMYMFENAPFFYPIIGPVCKYLKYGEQS